MAVGKTINLAPTTEDSSAYAPSGSVSTRDFKVLRRKTDNLSASLTVAQDNIDLRVTYDDVINAINVSSEGIIIQANRVNLSGLVTFSNLSTPGQTTINGANITTGTMSADRIYGGTINGNTVSVINLNASNISAGTISADRLAVNSISANRISAGGSVANAGYIYFNGANITLNGTSIDDASLNFNYNGTVTRFYNNTAGGVRMSGSFSMDGSLNIYGTTYANANLYSDNHYPSVTNSYNVGSSSLRWSAIYAQTTTIQTSDIRMKRDILPITGGIDLVLSIKPVQYKFIDGNRIHYGLIAQEVKESMTKVGIGDAAVYIDPNVSPDWDVNNPEENDQPHYLGIRYSELIAPMVQTIQHLNERITQLENARTL